MTLHIVLGGFFLPVGIMFAVTGGLYTWGSKGSYDTKTWEVPAQTDLKVELPYLMTVAGEVLKVAQLEGPSGAAGIKKMGATWQLEWTGSRADFLLEPSEQAGMLKAQYKKTDGQRFFVQLHKAKGGTPFKVLAAAFAVALILLLFSGLLMSLSSPIYTRRMVISLVLGTIVTFAAFFTS